jgi:Zn-dependent metalloprotease
MSMPWPRWPLLLASLLAGPSLAAGEKLAPVPPTTLLQLRAREPSRAAESLSLLKAQRPALGLNDRDDFRPSSIETDSFGLTHTHFQQLHQGVPVWGAVAITHLDPSGRGLSVTKDSVRSRIHVGTRPVVDAASAAALALLEVSPLGLVTKQPAAELVIYPEVKQVGVSGGKRRWQINAEDLKEEVVGYRLAWHVHTVLDNRLDGVKQTDFLLDARTGEVIKRWNSLHTAAAVATGRSQYSGEVELNVYQNAAGRYELRDTTRTYGEGLRTYDVNHARLESGESATPVLYEDEDNVWGDGQNYDPSAETLSENGQTAAVDAHFGLQATWDYYQKIHHRFGIDNAGTPTFNRVHVSNAWDNAFWDDDCYCMSYGDGSFPEPGGFKSLESIDVTGHELSHGVMSKTAGLIYSGESGGLNEANSDIFGTLTEFWVRNGRGDTIGDTGGNWTLGEELNPVPLRYMYKPSLDGVSRDAWSASLGSIDVHFSSGPMNRAFYFLAQGARPTATPNDYSSPFLPGGMTGIGNDKAAAIWYRAITVYLTPSSNYVAARAASLRSAADLNGSTSEEYRAVQNAFSAINVGYSAGTYDDLTRPTVTASLSGSAPLLRFTAKATDNVGVTRVEFNLDNSLVGSTVTQPFQLSLDTTLLGNGPHQVVVKAFDTAGNAGSSAPVHFTVANSFSQLLLNPGFEQGAVAWVEGALENINYPYPGAHTGQGFVWLNGYGEASVDSVYQQVTIPADAQTAALTFYQKIFTDDSGTTAQDTVVVRVRDTQGT